MKAHRDAAEQLGDILGEHHDLAVLQQTLAADPDDFGKSADLEVMIGLARRRQALLAAQSFPLGERLLAESGAQLTRRWHAYWDVWRSERPADEVALAA